MVGDMLSYDPYGIMYRKDDPGMAEAVERAFARLAATGEIVRLYDKWFLEPLPTGERLNRPMICAARGKPPLAGPAGVSPERRPEEARVLLSATTPPADGREFAERVSLP